MQRLYEDNLEQDLFFWRQRLGSARLNASLLHQLFLNYYHMNPSVHPEDYQSTSHNVVLIKNNTWYTPFWPLEYNVDCMKRTVWCDNRMKFNQWAFNRWTQQLGLQFPDVVFFHDITDAGICHEPGRCTVPVFSFFEKRFELGFEQPLSLDGLASHNTILLPSMYTDVDRDAQGVHGAGASVYPLFYYPWEKKIDKAVFRGTGFCPYWHKPKVVACSRWHLANESLFNGHNDTLDVAIDAWSDKSRPLPPPTPLPLRDHARYKFVLSLDGISASNRLGKLLGTNSVVLKEDSPYMGHFYRSLVPYEHYIPVISRHPNDVIEVVRQYASRQQELRRIAANGQAFAAKYLCDRAIGLYVRKALVEYKALFSDMQEYIDSRLWPYLQAKLRLGLDPGEAIGVLTDARGFGI